MKLPAKIAAWLLPLLLAGCFHKSNPSQTHPLAPPIDGGPKLSPTHPELPPSAMTIPSRPLASDANAEPQQAIKPHPKRRKQVVKPAPQQQAAIETPGVSAVGQLSSGDFSDLQRQAMDSISATERGLRNIGRRLTSQEQKTAAQIREYLKQARAALNSGDVDGAYTLTAKAKVLLGELNR
jgi:ribosomal protein S20